MDLHEIFARVRSIELKTPDEMATAQGRVLARLFLTKSQLVTDELFPLMENLSRSVDFEAKWIELFQARAEREKAEVIRDAAECRASGRDERFYLARLPSIDARALVNSFEALKKYLDSPTGGGQGLIECFANECRFLNNADDGYEYISNRYFWFVLADLLYERYVVMVSTFELFQRATASVVEQLYAEIGVCLTKCDQQFAKYGLLSFDENFRMSISRQERAILDSRIPQRRFVVDVPRDLMASIESATRFGLVKQLSFRVEAVRELAIAFEALEYGALFSFDAMALPATTRLYEDMNYENSLWISVDKKKASLTFEELLDDFSEIKECVLTQVIHLELTEEGGTSYISHIDHEYILYDLLQYAERQRSGDVKGHDKLKTFKIDGARIPWAEKLDGRYFLYTVLDAYFVRKALLREYFANLLNQ